MKRTICLLLVIVMVIGMLPLTAFAASKNYIEVVKDALRKQERTLLLSAFCSHQAIEKALKAYLLYEKGYAPDGHNVIFLCKQAARSVPSFKQWLDECVELNGYYISTRYPPDFPLHIDKKKAASLHKMAKSLYIFVFKTLTGAIYEA